MSLVGPVLDLTAQASNDNCPDTFWIEITNPSALWARDLDSFSVDLQPAEANSLTCTKPWTLFEGFPDPATSYYTQTAATGMGGFTPCPSGPQLCLPTCSGLPTQELTQADAAATVVRYGTPVVPGVSVYLYGHRPSDPPR